MEIITFLVVGLIAGWLAGLLVKGHGLGTVGDIIVGIIGALVGGYIFGLSSINTYGFLGAVLLAALGAIVFLFVIGLFSGSHRLQRH